MTKELELRIAAAKQGDGNGKLFKELLLQIYNLDLDELMDEFGSWIENQKDPTLKTHFPDFINDVRELHFDSTQSDRDEDEAIARFEILQGPNEHWAFVEITSVLGRWYTLGAAGWENWILGKDNISE